MPEWISVKDRLPEAETPVLVVYLGYTDNVPRCDAIANIYNGEWCWYHDETSDNDEIVEVEITHWIPLPKLPSPTDEIVYCKYCAHAVESKHSPAFYKCTGCSYLRGRLVSSTFWCKCGEKKEKTK